MYAVVKTGGKQYRVAEGDVIKVEKLEAQLGATIELDQVLMVADDESLQLGHPIVEGAKVSAEIVDQDRDRKVLIFKYRRRKRYRRKAGHRQPFTALKIIGITA
ncbi:MAG: 50S ribosomal protein L21 [Deltaproteobacteria bacterium]|nr:50S ribosomal protein L21 [Deltaproteobacteria bacterium]